MTGVSGQDTRENHVMSAPDKIPDTNKFVGAAGHRHRYIIYTVLCPACHVRTVGHRPGGRRCPLHAHDNDPGFFLRKENVI